MRPPFEELGGGFAGCESEAEEGRDEVGAGEVSERFHVKEGNKESHLYLPTSKRGSRHMSGSAIFNILYDHMQCIAHLNQQLL